MVTVQTLDDVGDRAADVDRLLAAVEAATGRAALSDQLAADRAGGAGLVAAVATGDDGRLVGYGQASAGNDATAVEVVVDPTIPEVAGVQRPLLDVVMRAVGARGGAPVNWFVAEPSAEQRAIAADLGLAPTRELLQMRRPLPTGLEVSVDTRPYVPGADDAGVLEVNNRAFADHAEQGGWTVDTLRQRQREGWFDPAGLRIHERDQRIAAFCWTKVHPATAHDRRLGEIYVIAVHPDFHGRGLGRQMTLAGLDHLAGAGITTGMLWVDAGNVIAVHLYERLGFTVTATTVAFTSAVSA